MKKRILLLSFGLLINHLVVPKVEKVKYQDIDYRLNDTGDVISCMHYTQCLEEGSTRATQPAADGSVHYRSGKNVTQWHTGSRMAQMAEGKNIEQGAVGSNNTQMARGQHIRQYAQGQGNVQIAYGSGSVHQYMSGNDNSSTVTLTDDEEDQTDTNDNSAPASTIHAAYCARVGTLYARKILSVSEYNIIRQILNGTYQTPDKVTAIRLNSDFSYDCLPSEKQ